jgi:hypothetical protein
MDHGGSSFRDRAVVKAKSHAANTPSFLDLPSALLCADIILQPVYQSARQVARERIPTGKMLLRRHAKIKYPRGWDMLEG